MTRYQKIKLRCLTLIILCIALIAPNFVLAAGAPGHPQQDAAPDSGVEIKDGKVIDRLEEENRARFAYNQKLDRIINNPLAKGYRIVPKGVRIVLRNAINNLSMPLTLGNHLLQGNFTWAVMDVGRFAINSTIGFAGMFDIAAPMGLPKNSTDFGITLGVWGVKTGPYLQLPLLGPSNLRDGFGFALEIATPNPLQKALNFTTIEKSSMTVVRYLDIRESLIEPLELMQANALDPYIQLKSFYEQGREAAVRRAIIGPKADLMSKSSSGGYPGGGYPGSGARFTTNPPGQTPTTTPIFPGSGDPAWGKRQRR